MRYRLLPALLGLALAGCTSSEPQDISYAPPPETAASVPGTPSPEMGSTMPEASSTPDAAVQFPPNGPPLASDPAPQARNCRTVGAVTTCDAPPDPSADDTHYTN